MSKTYLMMAMVILEGGAQEEMFSILSAKAGLADAYEDVLSSNLVAADKLQHTGSDFIHTALIITNVQEKSQDLLPGAKSRKSKIFSFLSDLLESILMFSTGTPLHLVILTDLQSLEQINRVRIQAG